MIVLLSFADRHKKWLVSALSFLIWVFALLTFVPFQDKNVLLPFLGLSLAIVLGFFVYYIIKTKIHWSFYIVYLLVIALGVYCLLKTSAMIVTYSFVYVLLIYLTCSLLVFMFLTYAYAQSLKVEYIFLVVAFIIGLIAFLGPKPGFYDERPHFARAYSISEGDWWGNKPVLVPEESEYLYDLITAKLPSVINRPTSTNLVPSSINTASLYPPTTYIPQVLGIITAKILHLNIYYTVHFARLGQLLFYLFLMFFAIRVSPINKTILLTIGLFPQVIKHASYPLGGDSTIIALTFLLCAFTIYANLTPNYKIKRNEKIFLIIGSILLSLLKISYLPILGFLFLIPARCFETTKEKYLTIFGTIAVAFLLNIAWFLHSFNFLSTKSATRLTASPNEQLAFILSNPIEYCIIFLRTIKIHGLVYLGYGVLSFGLFGYLYNSQILFFFASIFIMIVSSKKQTSWVFTPLQWIWIGLVIGTTVGLIGTSLYIQWTPLRQFTIDGIQGRYFLPMYFFALVFLRRVIPFIKTSGIEKYAFLIIALMDLSSSLMIILSQY